MSDNRRVFPRFDISLAAEVNTGQDLFAAEAKNLSQGGVGLALASPLPEQALLGISLFIVEDGIEDETGTTLDVQGQVIWVAESDAGSFEVGVRFAPLPPNQIRLLDQLLARLG
ncbi:MAG: PilZ domain-containing protein [Deltaproteobacteria bacterium]|nr:PilZ domain-containing protein [Deltaproteobacteria bacterium]